jgi:MFS superfamily sulfate permease-like transporter
MLNSPGITIGAVVVPQGMAYAVLADLAPQFGLYSSFMGVLIYWFFATSKDITIGVSSQKIAYRGVILTDCLKACRCDVDPRREYSCEGRQDSPQG